MIRLRRFDEKFFEQFSQRIDATVQRLNNYIADPSEKNIHDMRTSIRRAQAAYSVIPRSMRKKRLTVFIKKYNSFFKANSKIRDYDMILARLERYGFQDGRFIGYLNKKRGKQVESALGETKSLLKLKTPPVHHGPSSYAKINERFRGRCLSLTSEMRSELPKVARDESRAKELHELRITVKKLRYLLELQASGDLDSVISGMKVLQKILGQIHDSDMFADYMTKKSAKFPSLEPLIRQEKEARHQTFEGLSKNLGLF